MVIPEIFQKEPYGDTDSNDYEDRTDFILHPGCQYKRENMDGEKYSHVNELDRKVGSDVITARIYNG